MTQQLNLDISPAEIEEVFAPGIQRAVPAGDPEWTAKESQLRAKAVKRPPWWRRLLPSREAEKVRDVYEKKWTLDAALARFTRRAENTDPIVWGDRHYFAHSIWTKRVHLLFLMRLIETLKPTRVLELGSGMGLNLLLLADKFPDIRFTGVELTSSGHDIAQTLRVSPRLPRPLIDFSPLPVSDNQAHQKVELFQGSAAQLPFEKDSFDLVYSIQAMEQMEAIRDQVFAEVVRVCSGHVAMFEPFADWNADPVRKHLMISRKFFAASIADLQQYNLKPVFVSDDMPTKLSYGLGLVVARRAQQE